MEVYEMIGSMIPNLPRRKRYLYNSIETLFFASTYPLFVRLMQPLYGKDAGPFDVDLYLISVGLGIILYPLVSVLGWRFLVFGTTWKPKDR